MPEYFTAEFFATLALATAPLAVIARAWIRSGRPR